MCCLSNLFLSDQMCPFMPPNIFQCRAYDGDLCANFWKASVISPSLISGNVGVGGVFFDVVVIFHTA